MLVEEVKIIKKEVYVAPCVKCGSNNIDIFNYGYGTSNYGGGECRDCKNKSTDVVCVNPDKIKLIKIWNNKNDISHLLLEQENIINKANKEIIRLTEILNKRIQ